MYIVKIIDFDGNHKVIGKKRTMTDCERLIVSYKEMYGCKSWYVERV